MRRIDLLRRSALAAVAALGAGAALAAPQEDKGETVQQETVSRPAKAIPEDAGGRPAVTKLGAPEARLAELGIELPTPPAPVANYVRAVRTGNLVFLAGHGPLRPGGGYVTGKLGEDLGVAEGYEAARLTAIALLASLKAEIGSLDRVRRVVRVEGMVNSTADFTDQSKVINGCSDFLVEVFGERGKHARAAVGMASLPIGLAVEIHMVVEVE
ncbi:MAG: RidA family protein [Thermoanaerobaculia bacterium]